MCVFHHHLDTHLVNKSKHTFKKKNDHSIANNGTLEFYNLKLYNDICHLRLEPTLGGHEKVFIVAIDPRSWSKQLFNWVLSLVNHEDS